MIIGASFMLQRTSSFVGTTPSPLVTPRWMNDIELPIRRERAETRKKRHESRANVMRELVLVKQSRAREVMPRDASSS